MRIGIPRERRPNEARVAVSPDTVKKLVALGAEVMIETGAGTSSAVPDGAYAAAGARIAVDEAESLRDADVVLKVQRPLTCGRRRPGRAGAHEVRRHADRHPRPLCGQGPGRRLCGPGRQRLRDGIPAAHHARADHGRAVLPGQPRRLSRGDRGGRRLRPRLPDDDDGRRHGGGGARHGHGRRRRRPAGDRHRAPPRRRRLRDRRAAGRQGAGAEPGRHLRRRRGRGIQAGRDRRRLRQGDERRLQGQAGGAHRRDHQEAGHRHHHRAHPGPARPPCW